MCNDWVPPSTAASAYGNSVSLLLGNGDGTLQPHVDFATGTEPYGVMVKDFNGGGKLDLVTANVISSTISILLGNGNGTFQAHVDYPTATGPSSVALADFNKDGKIDVAVSSGNSAVSVLLGNGDGSFQPTGSSRLRTDRDGSRPPT